MQDYDETTRADALSLAGVLAHALPPELGTPAAPDRYTVPAVFSRHPLPREVEILEGADARDELARSGYASVTLKAVDLRLEIGNTTLDELESGLATVLGTMLRNVSLAVATVEADRLADLRLLNERELQRSEAVVERASRIGFEPRPSVIEAESLPAAM
jgi:hypothetical protein